jgi:hypothetical protein
VQLLPGKRSAVTGFADHGPRVRLQRPQLAATRAARRSRALDRNGLPVRETARELSGVLVVLD